MNRENLWEFLYFTIFNNLNLDEETLDLAREYTEKRRVSIKKGTNWPGGSHVSGTKSLPIGISGR